MSRIGLAVASAASLLTLMLLAGCGDDGREAVCDPACGVNTLCCAGEGGNLCRATASDVNHCGGCGISCGAGQSCVLGSCSGGPPGDSSMPMDSTVTPGMCTPSCASSQRCCGSTCANRSVPTGTNGRSDTSFQHCNGCGLACDPDLASACSVVGSGAPQCVCGDFACIPGEACVEESTGFRCVNTQTDRNNCGSIGNVCPGEEICQAGVCSCGATGAACGAGTSCCGGACIDTQSDVNNCGTCGNECGASGPSCVDGACRCGTSPACTAPSGSNVGQSCCDDTCVNNSPTSCGCGVVCDDGENCIVDMGILGMGGSGEPCCGTEILPGLGGFCSGFGLGDGGLPGFDAGIPIP